MSRADALAWYAAFGTNLSRERLACYVQGGTPVGASRSYDGCRDPTPPREDRTLTLPGRLRFAGRSAVWGGGMAFYAPGDEGEVHARVYLLRLEQIGDLVAQESRHPVGAPLVLADGGVTRHGMSRIYDVVLHVGDLDGHPIVTLSSSRDHPTRAPSGAYLRTMARGLADGFGLDLEERVAYLAGIDGMWPAWTQELVRRVLEEGPH